MRLQPVICATIVQVVTTCHDGVFDATTAGGVIFTAATGVDANAIAQVQACVRRRVLRSFVQRGLLPGDDAQAMAQWEHGGGFSVGGSVCIEAEDRAGRERPGRYRRFDSPARGGSSSPSYWLASPILDGLL